MSLKIHFLHFHLNSFPTSVACVTECNSRFSDTLPRLLRSDYKSKVSSNIRQFATSSRLSNIQNTYLCDFSHFIKRHDFRRYQSQFWQLLSIFPRVFPFKLFRNHFVTRDTDAQAYFESSCMYSRMLQSSVLIFLNTTARFQKAEDKIQILTNEFCFIFLDVYWRL